jgi:DNA-directed RNA polymerase specialized sigma24 family protein
MQGMDYKQIAETMAVSVSAVESLLSRARAGLRKKLQAYYTSNASS